METIMGRNPRHKSRRRPGAHHLPVTPCLTCEALLPTQPALPDLCPYCGGDPLNRPHALSCTKTQDVVAWQAGVPA